MNTKPYLIVGLGNPDEQHKNTRHNAGFLAIDSIAQKIDCTHFSSNSKLHALVAQTLVRKRKIILAKPFTYMNRSGQSVHAIARFYDLDMTKDVLIIHDELDLPLGQWKLTHDRGAAGHNGVSDIIQKTNTKNFNRIRIGIDSRTSGMKQNMSGADFVLGTFTTAEKEKLHNVLDEVVDEIMSIM